MRDLRDLINCKFCTNSEFDSEEQHLFCEKRGHYIGDTNWPAKHCDHYELDEVFKPKMSKEKKCVNCDWFRNTSPRDGMIKHGNCKRKGVIIIYPLRISSCTDFFSSPVLKEKVQCGKCGYYRARTSTNGSCKKRSYTNVSPHLKSACTSYKEFIQPTLIKCTECKTFPVDSIGELNVHCVKRAVLITSPMALRVCHRFEKREVQAYTGSSTEQEYMYARWDPLSTGSLNNVHGYIQPGEPVGIAMDTSYPSSDELEVKGNTIIKGDLTVEGEIKMNDKYDEKIKEKQDKINLIVKARIKYMGNWSKKFKELDQEIRENYILDYNWLRKEFIEYIVKNIERKNRKTFRRALGMIRMDRSQELVSYGKRGKRELGHLLSGEDWNFVKKILVIITKYASSYANERLKVKYSDLTSKYDALLYDDETEICERCGVENQITAIYCNNCGKRF